MLVFFTENWKMKLLALGCALVMWFYVMGERRLEVGYAVPIELKNVPQGLLVASDVPNTIDIRLSGPRALLSDLDEKDIRISVDLVGLKPGLTTFSRLEDYLRLPVGIRATRISPAFIDVKLDRIVQKTVPLRAHLSGELPSGYRLVAVELLPERVEVQGAEGEISPVNEVMTERIELGSFRGDREVVVPLVYRGKYSQLKDISHARVRLRIVGPGREIKPAKR